MFEGEDKSPEALLSEFEVAELMKVRREAGVVGYALVDRDGKQLATDGIEADILGPVFANAFDIASAIGRELGEAHDCPAMFFESDSYELAAIALSSCSAIIVREKPKSTARGFGNAG